jgi:hypothetical protein
MYSVLLMFFRPTRRMECQLDSGLPENSHLRLSLAFHSLSSSRLPESAPPPDLTTLALLLSSPPFLLSLPTLRMGDYRLDEVEGHAFLYIFDTEQSYTPFLYFHSLSFFPAKLCPNIARRPVHPPGQINSIHPQGGITTTLPPST